MYHGLIDVEYQGLLDPRLVWREVYGFLALVHLIVRFHVAMQLEGVKCLYQVHPVYLDHRVLHRGYPLALGDVRGGLLMIADLVLICPLLFLLLVVVQEVNFEGILDFDVCFLLG